MNTAPLTKADASNQTQTWDIIGGIVIFLGVIIRMYMAWSSRYLDIPDTSIVLLMAKHMAEGLHVPFFYYGQAYMGTLEPLTSALFCVLFGTSSFAVYMGTVAWGAMVPLVVFLWVRDAAGSRAGAFAALFLLIHSDTLIHFGTTPRGGYMTLLVLGLLTVLLVNRYAAQVLTGKKPYSALLIGAGFVAGLGWWSHQMIIVFFGAATVIALCILPKLLRKKATYLAIAAFFVGSLPWWYWNVLHQWATFAFGSSMGQLPFAEGLKLFVEILPKSLGYDPITPINIVRMAVLLLVFGLALKCFTLMLRKIRVNPLPALTACSALLIFLFMLAFYATSHFAAIRATRYVIAIILPVAFFVGVGIDYLLRHKWTIPLGLICFLILLPPTYMWLPSMWKQAQRDVPAWENAHDLGIYLQETADGVGIGSRRWSLTMFASDEKGIVANIPIDNYAPYNQLAARAEKQVFIDNFNGLDQYLLATHTTGTVAYVGRFAIMRDIQPPSTAWDYLAVQNIHSTSVFPHGADITHLLADENLDTIWKTSLNPEKPVTLEWNFIEAIDLAGFRIPGQQNLPKTAIQIEGRTENGTWTTLQPSAPVTGFFRSGSRIYYTGYDWIQEHRFPPTSGGLLGLRITWSSMEPIRLNIPEVVLLTAENGIATVPQRLQWQDLVAQCEKSGIERLFAPRWITENLFLHTTPAFDMRISQYLTRTVDQLPYTDDMGTPQIDLDRCTGFLVREKDLERSRKWLNAAQLSWEEFDAQGFVLLVVSPDKTALETWVPVVWSEYGLYGGDGRHQARARSVALLDRAQTAPSAERYSLLERAVELAPEHRTAATAWVQELTASAKPDLAVSEAKRLKLHDTVDVPLHAHFSDGIQLIGIDLDNASTAPGTPVSMTYHWHFKPTTDLTRWSVFVHFVADGKIVFQDDHNLSDYFEPETVEDQPFNVSYLLTRQVQIPPVHSGEIAIRIGLVSPFTGQRSLVRTGWLLKNAVIVPDAIQVPD